MTTMYPELVSYAAIDNTNLINTEQWAKIAKLALRSSSTVEHVLSNLRVDYDENASHEKQNFVGKIPCGKDYYLHGMLHWTGSTHT